MGRAAESLKDRLYSIVSGMDFEFVGCEWHQEGRISALRIYIEKEKGVSLEDCADVSRQVAAVLDVEELVQGKYKLEVSSPGINRPLFTFAQYQQYVGQQVKVQLQVPHEGRRHFNGILLWAKDQELCVEINSKEYVFPFDSVRKGNLVNDVNFEQNSAY